MRAGSKDSDEGRTVLPGLRNHDPAYGAGFSYRGNVTSRATPASVVNFPHDITGTRHLGR